ncbi:MAG: glycosyltransferase [Planctomycetaceae bacterium]|nr:glycosyltransferase [Planctomycetaceae bacterium]
MLADHYQRGIENCEAGRLEEALAAFELYLKERPSHGKAWNDAGTVLYRLGRMDEAIGYFLNALRQEDRPGQACRNLVCAYLKAGQPGRAMQQLKTTAHEQHADIGLAVRTAAEFQRQQELASAMEMLQYGKRLPGDAAVLEQQIAQLRNKRARIAFFCGGDGQTFLKDIIEYCRQRYPVRIFEGQSPAEVFDLMQWSDISWFEWCTELAQTGTNLPKVCRNIIRLHRYEAYLSWPQTIRWENVDTLITVGNSWVIAALKQCIRDIEERVRIVTIHNGVDLDKFAFKQRRPGKNIAFAASLRMVKNPMLLVQCMAELWKRDPGYQLYYAGTTHDKLLQQYIEHGLERLGMTHAFHFDGFQEDMTAWLEDKNYLVSTSVIESQGMGILEAMAAGIKPVIHDFPGAEEIFGKDHLFATPQEFCKKILESQYDSSAYREFVERRYPLDRQLLKINELLAEFEKQDTGGLTDSGVLPEEAAAAAV